MKIKNSVITGTLLSAAIAGSAVYFNRYAADQAEIKQADNKVDAERCINIHSSETIKGTDKACDRVDQSLLSGDTLTRFKTAFANHKQAQADAKAKAAKEKEEADKARRAKLAAAAKAKAAEEAKFKAEGWWEAQNGIFIRWCGSSNPCPGPTSNGYSDYTWQAMVWCKEHACGDIYARLNILNGETIVGWTNETAYADYGQKVVLTFGSSTRGSGRIVEFIARG